MGDRYGPQHLRHDALLLLGGQLREHGKRQHLRGSFLSNREIADTKTKSLVGFRQVKRNGIVNPCADAGFVQPLLKLRTIGDA